MAQNEALCNYYRRARIHRFGHWRIHDHRKIPAIIRAEIERVWRLVPCINARSPTGNRQGARDIRRRDWPALAHLSLRVLVERPDRIVNAESDDVELAEDAPGDVSHEQQEERGDAAVDKEGQPQRSGVDGAGNQEPDSYDRNCQRALANR